MKTWVLKVMAAVVLSVALGHVILSLNIDTRLAMFFFMGGFSYALVDLLWLEARNGRSGIVGIGG